MKNNSLTKQIICIALLGAFSADPALAVEVEHLRCEYLANPNGIDVLRPRLSWLLDSDRRGAKQTAYQVVVTTTHGELWDSGKVESAQSIQVEYAGKPLSSRQTCEWKVRVWDKDGKLSVWSKPATWTMGLLKPDDWQAKWIGSPSADLVAPAPLLRKTFTVTQPVKRATVYATGLGFYELHLNGGKVGDHEMDPGFTRYDRRVLYATHDVTAQIHRGVNTLGMMLGNGWYNYSVPTGWDYEKAVWRAQPKMILQLELELADGTTQTIFSDESWQTTAGPVVFNALLNGEFYDARREISDWDNGSAGNTSWTAAKVVAPPTGILAAQMAPPVKVTQTLQPVKLTQPKPGVFVYDLGQNLAGVAEITLSGPAGTVVELKYGEKLNPDGTLNQDELKMFAKTGDFQMDRYTLKGRGTEVWRPRFVYHGFQYVQVTGFPGTPTLKNLRALAMNAAFETAGQFECSNELLNQIQHNTLWSARANYYSFPTDCPQREKGGWTGDGHLSAEAYLYNFNIAANYTKWLQDFQDEQQTNGVLPAIIPTAGWGYAWGNGPAWDSAYLLIPWNLYLCRGDRRILSEHYENFKLYVDYVSRRATNHIANFGLGDWCSPKTTTPERITSTGYFYRDACIVADIAGMLGKKDDAVKYAALAEDIKQSFNRNFPELKTQTALGCALYQGLAEPANRPALIQQLVANIESKGNHLDCGNLGAKYLLHALSDNGRAEVAYKLATQTTMPSWGYWINIGATTLLEHWDDKNKQGLSRNHIMFGDISAWFYESLAGIRPDGAAPGFKHIILKPVVVGDLKWVKAHHDSPYGRIRSEWKSERGTFTWKITVPPNTSATVHVPTSNAGSVKEGGHPLAKVGGVKFLRMENGYAVLEVESGNYVFSSAHSALASRSLPAAAATTFLHAQGQDIVNEQGEKVMLRGVGLGNWLLGEGYMWKFGPLGDRPRKIEKLVDDLVGPEYGKQFWSEFRQHYITEADIKCIADQGFNSVRPALNSRLFLSASGKPTGREEGFRLLDNLVTWCKAHSIYVIIDLHGAPGGQTGMNIDDSANNQPELFMETKYQDQLVALWQAIARRYKDEPTIAGYDLLNEPLPEGTGAAKKHKAQLEPLYKRVTKAIREIDAKHMILLEGADWAGDWSVFSEPFDKNLVYQFHYYCWGNPPVLTSIQRYLDYQNRFNVPVWVGEIGEMDNTVSWATTESLEANNIGWSYWPWKKMDTRNTPCSIKLPAQWAAIVAYSRGGEKPSREIARQAFDELLVNIRLENCVFFPDVVNAMLRRVPAKIEGENYGQAGLNQSYFVHDTNRLSKFYRQSEPVAVTSRATIISKQTDQNITLNAQEWTAYSITSDSRQDFGVNVRVKAVDAPAEAQLISGSQVRSLTIPQNTWQEIKLDAITLVQGNNQLKWQVISGVADMDWIELSPAGKNQPALAPVGSVIRIDAGSVVNFTDAARNIWLADRGFEGGGVSVRADDLKIENTTDARIYRTEHWGMSSFSQSLPNGKYVVRLHFAETWDGVTGPGGRIFSFNVEGQEFKDIDLWVKAGGRERAYIETVNVTIADGTLDILFERGVDNPEINAIEIIPAS
jgi:alpha-L-rhamnosidase